MGRRPTSNESLGRTQEAPAAAGAFDVYSAARIVRASLSQLEDALILLDEYYRQVGVVQRDTPDEVRSFLSNADSGLWIAYVGDKPAGCVVLRPLDGFQAAGECKRLYVRPQFRRRGIAEALLDAMEDHARSSSLSWIYLDSKDDLQVAIALYRRRGYEPCERYNDNTQATVFLRTDLSRFNRVAK
jgi:ribosomal protein S18 acetylase RimI-like enzyme